MEENQNRKLLVQLDFEEISLPPFDDILVLGKKCPQGKNGVYRSFEMLIPNEFEVLEINDKIVEAIFVNKRILKKIDREKVISILRERVFPYVSECEMVKVGFKLKSFYDPIEIES